MQVKKTELLEALSRIKPGLSDKKMIEQTDCFVFDESGFVRTYNDEISVSVPLKIGFSAAVKAQEFFELISKLEAEKISLTLSEKDQLLSIESGKIKGQMIVSTEIKCPAVDVGGGKWLRLPKNFVAAVGFCSFSAERRNAISVLTYLLVDGEYVCSSDRFRATKYKMDGPVQKFLLPVGVAQELVGCEPTHYVVGDVWVNFKNKESVVFSSRIFDGKYPEEIWEVFGLKKNEAGDVVPVPEGLKNAVECGQIFSRDDLGKNDLVSIKVSSGKMICRGQGPLGYVEQEFDVGYKKRDFEILAPANALTEILSRVSEIRVLKDKLYFRGADFEHVISLL